MTTRGVIFDLDGTLVDSQLDFGRMRAEMQLEEGLPILEAMEDMEEPRLGFCRKVLARHEQQGVERSTKIVGVDQMLQQLRQRGLKLGVITRNSRRAAEMMLAKHALEFDPVWTREDGPCKPDPWAILETCKQWQFRPADVVMVGDFRFDIESGQRAGAGTTYFSPRGENDCGAEFVVQDYQRCKDWLAWMLAR